MENEVRKIPICFPVVWNGLIDGNRATIQQRPDDDYDGYSLVPETSMKDDEPRALQAVLYKVIFNVTDMDTHDSDTASYVNRPVMGDKTRKLKAAHRSALLSLDNDDRIQILVERIRRIGITGIRDVVSAFHHYLETHLKVAPTDMITLDNAIRLGFPELYIARALIAGLRFNGVPEGFTKDLIPELRLLEHNTEYPDLFTIVPQTDPELWEKALRKQAEDPTAFDQASLVTLSRMTKEDTDIFKSLSHAMLWPADPEDSRYMKPIIICTIKEGMDDYNAMYWFLTPDRIVRMQELGLITHPQPYGFRAYSVYTDTYFISAIRFSADVEGAVYFHDVYYLTDIGLKIFNACIKESIKPFTEEYQHLNLCALCRALNPLVEERPELDMRLSVYHITEFDKNDAGSLHLDLKHDLFAEDMERLGTPLKK